MKTDPGRRRRLGAAAAITLGTLSLMSLSELRVTAETPVQAWVARYGYPGLTAEDQAFEIVADGGGNVVVAGYSTDNVTGKDMIVVKYSADGVALWTNRYAGPGNGDDVPTGLGVDTNGKVFVTGNSVGSGGFPGIATLAYSATGLPLWTNRYNDLFWTGLQANALAMDREGNVIVAGARATDFLVLKYSSVGVPLWTNRYTGPASGSEIATAVAVSITGHVVVTGYSPGVGSADDYATIMYSAAGAALWTNRYNGPANGSDQPVAVAVATNGDVYVTGSALSGSYPDYATVAYSASGVPLWTNRYNGPGNQLDQARGLACDSEGNVIVTGYSRGSSSFYDYATLKYSSEGVPIWTNRYNGPSGFNDYATALAVDGSGNVFVTGYSPEHSTDDCYATVAYASTGAPLWTNRYLGALGPGAIIKSQAQAVTVDKNGNVFVTGTSINTLYAPVTEYDFATIKYLNSGVGVWTNRYAGVAGGDDRARAVAVDGSGNVFVAGYSLVGPNTMDYVTIRYSSAGFALWTNRYNGPGNDQDYVMAMAVDGSGNAIVTGFSKGNNGYRDYATIKYSGAGIPLWTNRYDGPFNREDSPKAAAVDKDGNVFVTGSSSGFGSATDYATVAYSASGVPLWTNRYDGPSNSDDVPAAVAVDAAGNVFVTGSSVAPYAHNDFLTVAYAANGEGLWTNRYNGPGSGTDSASAMAVDKDGNVIVTGYSADDGTGNTGDYVTIKYSNSGVPVWTNHYHGPAYGSDTPIAVVADGSGNVIVTGNSAGSNGKVDYATVAYAADGTPLWTNRSNAGIDSDASAYALGVDASGNVFVTGSCGGDYATVKISNSGVTLWAKRYNGPANGTDQPQTTSCLAVDADGAVYVTGGSDGDYSTATTYDFATVKYISLPEIALQPASRTNNVGTTATFTVVATGSAPLSYQWLGNEMSLADGGNVFGTATNGLTLASVQAADEASYTVVITNAFGSVTSAVAVLRTVVPSPIWLGSASLANGVFTFAFSNAAGAGFSVWSATNVNLPFNEWTVLGSAAEGPPGQFRFDDVQSTNSRQKYYRVRSQ